MAKDYNGQFLSSPILENSETKTNIAATFTIADPNATSVTVVNENRTIPVTNGYLLIRLPQRPRCTSIR